MNEQMMKERIQQALNVKMSGVRTSLAERSRLYENAIGGTKVKRKMTVGLVFAIVLVLMTAAAVAAILLTHQEIVEQVAVPLAVDNDGELGVKQNYSAEELAELVRNHLRMVILRHNIGVIPVGGYKYQSRRRDSEQLRSF